MKLRNLFMSLILICGAFLLANAAEAATIYVNSSTGNDSTGDGSESTPYKTFHKAYTEAEASDTIDLTGTFTWTDVDETGDSSGTGYTIAKNITINGQGAGDTIIQAASTAETAGKRVFTIDSAATAVIQNVTIRYGFASNTNYGLGINNAGNLQVLDCEIYENINKNGTSEGGGIYNTGVLEVVDSAIYNNISRYGGGGIANGVGAGNLTITNSTIYSNMNWSTPSYGGGVQIRDGESTLTNNTIVGNISDSGSGVDIDVIDPATIYFKNNIIVLNDDIRTGDPDYDFSLDDGTVVSNGHNIVGRSSSYIWEGTGDWEDTERDDTYTLYSVGTEGTLNLDDSASLNSSLNGTHTYALLEGSIAINAGNATANNGITPPSTDQRGGARVSTIDVGAFEYGVEFADETAPELAESSPLSPADNATGVSISTNLVMTFNEDVAEGTGNIIIYNDSDEAVASIDVTSEQVTISGDTVTINPTADLESLTSYYIQMASGVIVDTSDNPYAGISDETTWNFTTADETDPTVSVLSPLNGASGVVVDPTLSIEFSENIVAGTGNIVLYKSDDTEIESFDIESDVTIEGAIVSFTPSEDLSGGTSYYVLVEATAIDDSAGNSFAGIASSETWSFTTVSTASRRRSVSTLSVISDPADDSQDSSDDSEDSADDSAEDPSEGSENDRDNQTNDGDTEDSQDGELDTENQNQEAGQDDNLDVDNDSPYLIKYPESPAVYLVEDGQKRPIVSGEVFEALGYDWSDIEVVDDSVDFETGDVVDGDDIELGEYEGKLVKYAEFTTVYLIENNLKRPIVSGEVFETLGYNWDDIIVISDSIQFETGEMIYGPENENNFNRNLAFGMVGDDVRDLQTYLNNNGFELAQSGFGSPGNETRYFGTLTLNAVIRFQQANDINPASGFVGLLTRAVLNR